MTTDPRALCAGLAPAWDSVIEGETPTQRKDRRTTAAATCRHCDLRDQCLADGKAGLRGGILGGHHFPDHVQNLRDLIPPVPGAGNGRRRPPCGSPGGAKAHRYREETVDDACLEAERAVNRDRMAALRDLTREAGVA